MTPTTERPNDSATDQDIYSIYDAERKVIILEIPYEPDGSYELSERGSTYHIAPNLKFNVQLETAANKIEHFFVTLGVYRFIRPPRSRR